MVVLTIIFSKLHLSWQVPMKPLSHIIERGLPPVQVTKLSSGYLRQLAEAKAAILQKSPQALKESEIIIDLGNSASRGPTWAVDYAPCLTRTRGKGNGFWVLSQHRWLTMNEKLRLMGLSPAQIPQGVVSESTLGAIAGNAVPIGLLVPVLRALLQTAR